MTCPSCGKSMTRGMIMIRGTALGFAVFGWSHQPLWWYPSGHEGAKEQILSPRTPANAHRCDSCHTVVFTGS